MTKLKLFDIFILGEIMYEEFNDYLKYNYLRHTLTHNQYRPKDKGLYAYTLLSLQEEIKQNLGDKITFLAWLEFNDRFFDKLQEGEQLFVRKVFMNNQVLEYKDELKVIFEEHKYRTFYQNQNQLSR